MRAGHCVAPFRLAADALFHGEPASYSCTFDSDTLVHTCDMVVGPNAFELTSGWLSLDDVVLEQVPFGVTRMSTQTLTDETSIRQTSFEYDADRLIKTVENSEDGRTTEFSSHDELGRPTSAIMSNRDCAGLPIAIAYDDQARTISRALMPLAADDCGLMPRVDVDTYDEDGNIVGIQEGNEEFLTLTVGEIEEVCRL